MTLAELHQELSKGSLAGARALLGWELVHSTAEGEVSGYIVEAEAYHQDGPAKLVQALGITPLHNATTFGTGDLRLRPGIALQQSDIATGPRIGISKATKELNRFYIKNSHFVSKK